MRSFFKVTQFLRDLMEEDDYINTIVFGDFAHADLQKKNIFPMGVINPLSASLANGQVNEFTFEIGVLNIRDLSTDEIVDKFISNDNEIFSLNSTFASLNKMMKEIRNRYNDDLIEIVSVSNANPIIFSNTNILDGWSIEITIQIPNISICL